MNYVLAAAAIAFAAGNRVSQALVKDRAYDVFPGIDSVQFSQRINKLMGIYDWETTLAQFNLLDSHDTSRVISIARGDKATLRLATLLQMTFPGAPCVYYGDEIALRGTRRYDHPHRDRDARWPFPWHDERVWDYEMLEFFRSLIHLRRSHAALRYGQFEPLYADGQQYALLRRHQQEAFLVALNAADDAATCALSTQTWAADGAELSPVFGAASAVQVAGGQVRMALPPRSGAIWQLQT
jgi:glycosidase